MNMKTLSKIVSNNWSTKCYYDFATIVVISSSSVCISTAAAAVATITTTTATGSQS